MIKIEKNKIIVDGYRIDTRDDFMKLNELDKKQVLEYRKRILNTPKHDPRTKKRH